MFTVFVYMCNVFNMSKQVTEFLGEEIVVKWFGAEIVHRWSQDRLILERSSVLHVSYVSLCRMCTFGPEDDAQILRDGQD